MTATGPVRTSNVCSSSMLVTDENPSSSIVSELIAFAMISAPKPGLNTKVSFPGPPIMTGTGETPTVRLAGGSWSLNINVRAALH